MPSPLNFWVDRQAPIHIDAACREAVDQFKATTSILVLPIINSAGEIIVLLDREYFLGSFARPFAWSLLSGRPLSQWLLLHPHLRAPEIIHEGTTSSEAAQRLATSSMAVNTLVMLDRQDRYVGLIHQRSLLMGMLNEVANARDEALAASDAKSLFLGTMSHELRTPLNGVIGLSDVLLLEHLTPAQHELVDLIKGSGERLYNLLSKVLDYTALESGKIQVEARPFILVDALQETCRCLSDEAQKKHLRMKLYVDPHLARTVIGDVHRLRQVLFNLLENSVKFTNHGAIMLRAVEAADGVVQFAVADSGQGMDDQTIDRLFKPFIQADASFTRNHEGGGLGLAISQRLVCCMGGCIQVRSHLGRGSRFQFTVPLPAA